MEGGDASQVEVACRDRKAAAEVPEDPAAEASRTDVVAAVGQEEDGDEVAVAEVERRTRALEAAAVHENVAAAEVESRTRALAVAVVVRRGLVAVAREDGGGGSCETPSFLGILKWKRDEDVEIRICLYRGGFGIMRGMRVWKFILEMKVLIYVRDC